MTTRRPVKERRPLLVGVIASPADLRFALAMNQPPDLFEVRLDCLFDIIDQLERKLSTRAPEPRRRRLLNSRTLSKLQAPIIITARDPREGGFGNLPLQKRRDLLSRFLQHAKYLDVELRSARAFKPLLAEARKRKVRVILSYHDFKSTPSPRSLRSRAASAKAQGAIIFKVACRTDSPAQLARLVDFITEIDLDLPVSAMGIGKLGGVSRLLLARCGSALNYGSLQQTLVEGQLPIDVLRSALPH